MQTLEKIAHSTMPFTTGGQTINDRLTAASLSRNLKYYPIKWIITEYSIAGSQLGKTVCKATTEELMAPKKKHLDCKASRIVLFKSKTLDLLHCTNEPNVSIPTLANLLIERTQNINQIVVYKALITIHNLMCYGNEVFFHYYWFFNWQGICFRGFRNTWLRAMRHSICLIFILVRKTTLIIINSYSLKF